MKPPEHTGVMGQGGRGGRIADPAARRHLVLLGSFVLAASLGGAFLWGLVAAAFGMILSGPMAVAAVPHYSLGRFFWLLAAAVVITITLDTTFRIFSGRAMCRADRLRAISHGAFGWFALCIVPFPLIGECIATLLWIGIAAAVVAKATGWKGGLISSTVSTLVVVTIAVLVDSTLGVSGYVMPEVSGQAQRQADTSQILNSILWYEGYVGDLPEHPALLLCQPLHASPAQFVATSSSTQIDDMKVGAMRLRDLVSNDSGVDCATLREAVRSQLGQVCRMGDYVFTYTKIANLRSEPRLWILLQVSGAEKEAGAGSLIVGLADGTCHPIDRVDLESSIEEQNQLRESMGVPALPTAVVLELATQP